ncbi:MAG: lysylphosphatidylglycerol synthase transmembrane domain-containing protein, partial [Pseudomonadota bacterium]
MTPTGNKPRKKVWKGRTIAIWTVLSAAIVFILLSLISDLGALKQAIRGFPLSLLVPIGLLSLGNYLLRYVKWHWYLELTGHRISPWPNLLVFLAGFALTVTPGKIGEFVKAFIVKERFHVPYTASTAVLLMERFTDIIAIILLSCLGLFLSLLHASFALISVLVLLGVVMLLRNRRFAGWVIQQSERFGPLKGFSGALRTLYENGWALLELKVFIPSLLISLAAWFLEGLGFAMVVWGLGAPFSLLQGVFI